MSLPGWKGIELGQLVAEIVGQIQHAAHVAHHCLGGHGAKGGDLRNAIGAVLGPHVIDDTVAAVLAKVDVEVRHRHPLGIQKRSNNKP